MNAMVKMILAVAVMTAGTLLRGAVMNDVPLVPRPQSLEQRGGAWRIPQEITVSASPGAESEIKFVTAAVERRFTGRKVKRVAGNGAVQLVLEREGVPENPEGYTLAVTQQGVRIAARDTRGIFYGIQTLGNLFLNVRDGRIRGVRIVDFPKLRVRETYLQVPGLRKKHLPEVRRLIDLFAGFKYNRVLLMLHKSFPYRQLKFKDASDLTAEDVRALAEYCRERHIEIVPGLQLLSHVRWLESLPEYKTLLEDPAQAKNWGCNWCPSNPRMREIWQQALADHIELLKPRHFHIYMDEINTGAMASCPRCRSIPQTEWVRGELRRIVAFLKERGVMPIAWHDSFLHPKHTNVFSPYRNKLEGWKLLDEFPAGSQIGYWGYGLQLDMPAIKYLLDRKMDIYCAAWSRCAGNIPTVARLMTTLGPHGLGASLVPFWFFTGTPDRLFRKYAYRSWVGIALGGECFWNPDAETPDLASLKFDPVFEARRRLFPEAVRRKERWQSVDITGALNTEFNREWFAPVFTREGFAQLVREYASRPEKFAISGDPETGALRALAVSALPDGRDGLSPAPGKVELGKLKTKRLAMLMAIVPTGQFYVDDNEWRLLRSSTRPKVGTLRIRWTDGKQHEIPLIRTLNISNWNAQFPGFEARFPVRSHDRLGRLVQFTQLEWRNSRPDVPIASIEVISAGYRERALALFALSAADAADLPAASPLPAKRFTGIELKSSENQRCAPLAEAEVARRELTGTNVKGKAACELIADPWHPGRKALKITIPPAASAPFGRVCCDLPVAIPEFAGGFAFRFRHSAPETNREIAIYLLDLAGNAYMHRLTELPKSGEVIVPFPLMTTEHNPGKHHAMKAIRFSFRQLNPNPVEIVVSIPEWQESPFIPIRWHKDQGE